MSALLFNEKSKMRLPLQAVEAPATTFTDVVKSSFTDRFANELAYSKEFSENKMLNERHQIYKDITGRDLNNDILSEFGEEVDVFGYKTKKLDPERNIEYTDKIISRLKAEDPVKYAGLDLYPAIQERARGGAREARAQHVETMKGADHRQTVLPIGSSPAGVGEFVGSMGAEFTDPVNLVTMPLGASKGAGLLKTALTEAGINMAAEAYRQPDIMEWQKEVGHEYGWMDIAQNVTLAGLFGGGMAVAKYGAEHLFRSSPTFFSELKNKMRETGAPKDVLAVVDQQAREAHLYDANPFRDNPDLDNGGHQKSLKEVDAAINEGRPIRSENLGIDSKDFSTLDTTAKAGDSELKINRLNDLENFRTPDVVDTSVKAQPELGAFDPNEYHPNLFPDQDFPEDGARTVFEASQLRSKDEFSPQATARRDAEFESFINSEDGENFVLQDIDGKEIDLESIKSQVKNDKSVLDAIRICSVGGKS